MTGGAPKLVLRENTNLTAGSDTAYSDYSHAPSDFSIGGVSAVPTNDTTLQALNAYQVMKKLGEGGFGKVRCSAGQAVPSPRA